MSYHSDANWPISISENGPVSVHNQGVCARVVLQKPREASVQNPAITSTTSRPRKALTKLNAKDIA